MIELIDAAIGYNEPIIQVSAKFVGKVFLLGPNGAGKTTLFRGIAGIAKLFSGELTVSGKPPKLAVNLQEVLRIVPAKVNDLISLWADLLWANESDMYNVLRILGFEEIYNKPIGALSSGQAKAVYNAIALGSGAANILLDEPFEGLDPGRKSTFVSYLEEFSGSVVVATHETGFLSVLKDWNVYLMFYGKLYGPFRSEEISSAGIVREYVEDAIVSIKTPSGWISLVRSGGKPLTSVYSMDQLFFVRFLSIMTRYWRVLLKTATLNYSSIFRGVIFVSFRVYLRVFKFLPSAPPEGVTMNDFVVYSAGYIFGYLNLIVVGSLGIAVTYVLVYGSIGLRYATLYTKLTPRRAVIESIFAGVLSFIIYELILFFETIFLLRVRFGVRARPRTALIALGIIISAFIVYGLSSIFAYLRAFGKYFALLREIGTLILAFLAYFSLRISYGRASYLNPFQVMLYFVIYSYLHEPPLMGGFTYGSLENLVDMHDVYLALIIRLILIPLIAWIEFKYARGVRPEDLIL